jgi:hypothetical protein
MLGARPESNKDELKFGVPAALQIAPIVDSPISPAPATPALGDEHPVGGAQRTKTDKTDGPTNRSKIAADSPGTL